MLSLTCNSCTTHQQTSPRKQDKKRLSCSLIFVGRMLYTKIIYVSARSSILAFNHSTYHVNIIIMSFNSALVIIWYFPVSGCMYLLHCIYYVRNIHKTKRNTRLYQGVPRLIYLNISLLIQKFIY